MWEKIYLRECSSQCNWQQLKYRSNLNIPNWGKICLLEINDPHSHAIFYNYSPPPKEYLIACRNGYGISSSEKNLSGSTSRRGTLAWRWEALELNGTGVKKFISILADYFWMGVGSEVIFSLFCWSALLQFVQCAYIIYLRQCSPEYLSACFKNCSSLQLFLPSLPSQVTVPHLPPAICGDFYHLAAVWPQASS